MNEEGEHEAKADQDCSVLISGQYHNECTVFILKPGIKYIIK